jgi:hypothetical protein
MGGEIMKYLRSLLLSGIVLTLSHGIQAEDSRICGDVKHSLADAKRDAWLKLRESENHAANAFKADESIFVKDEEVVPGEFDTWWKVCYQLQALTGFEPAKPECAPLTDFTTSHEIAMSILKEKPSLVPAGPLLEANLTTYLVKKGGRRSSSEVWQCLFPALANNNIPNGGKGYHCSFDNESLKTSLEYTSRKYVKHKKDFQSNWRDFEMEVQLHRSLFNPDSLYWRTCTPSASSD